MLRHGIAFKCENFIGGRTGMGSDDLDAPNSARLLAETHLDRFQTDSHESAMRIPDLESMQFEELWLIHEELTKILSERIVAEKRELEERLAKLNRVEIIRESGSVSPLGIGGQAPRRKYPKVLPKYANPQSPLETWSGRGKQPRWLVAALKTGHKLDEFKIGNVEKGVRKGRTARSQRT
jgi:DNA-binding protein H-NS